VLFLDGSGGTNSPVQSAAHSTFSNNDLSGNWYGQVVDRQSGGSIPAPNTTNLKNFRRNWWGTTSPVVTTANSAEPGYAAQIPVAYGGSATPPGGQPDIAGPASANIKFLPLLLSGTDTNVETAPGRGTNGFQGQQTPVLVWPPNQNGWTIQTSSTATAGFVEGPATPPLGVGSGRLSVGSDGDGAAQFRQSNFNGTPLSDLTALSYSSYTSNDGTAPAVGDQTVYVMLNVDLDGNGTNDTILFFEPEYQHGYTSAVPDQGDNVLNTWQTWDALHGGWWSTTGAAGANPGGDVKPLSDIVAAFPNARIHNSATSGSLRLVAGFGAGSWDNFVGNVDNVTVAVGLASATYDFEPLPALSIDDVTMNEGNTGTTPFTFTVTLSRAVDVPVTVDYSTADGTATAPADYAAAATTQLTFNPGETTKQVTVNVNGEDTFEPDETFFVNLSNASNATLLDAQGLGTITNDDTAPSFSINDVTMNEGDSGTTSFTFTVTKTGAGAASVDFATVDGTATVAGSDYQSNSGTLSFASGDATMTATVLVNGDTLYEADETFGVHLSNAVAAGISDADGTGTITNDDAPFTFSIDDVTMNEGDSGTTAFTFTVTKSGSAPLASSVNYATADGTAAAGSDYAAMSGTLNFASNETAKQVTVQVNGDTTPELDETFFVQLTAGSNASIADGSGTGTISNDDESVAAGQLIISEFRLRGPGNVSVVRPAGDEIPAAGGASSGGTTAASGGDDAPSTPGPVATSGGPQPNAVDATPEANDEFVELYNTTSSPLFVTTTDGSSSSRTARSSPRAPTTSARTRAATRSRRRPRPTRRGAASRCRTTWAWRSSARARRPTTTRRRGSTRPARRPRPTRSTGRARATPRSRLRRRRSTLSTASTARSARSWPTSAAPRRGCRRTRATTRPTSSSSTPRGRRRPRASGSARPAPRTSAHPSSATTPSASRCSTGLSPARSRRTARATSRPATRALRRTARSLSGAA
jgi:hypothetical protein